MKFLGSVFRLARCGVLLAATALAGHAFAANFAVTPTRLTFGETTKTISLEVTNFDDAELLVQVSVMKWAIDKDGVEQHSPTSDIVASPPIFKIPGHGVQTVRLGVIKRGKTAESAYRIMVQQVQAEVNAEVPAVAFLLRHSLPAFVSPFGVQVSAAPNFRLMQSDDGELLVQADNKGTAHILLKDFSLTTPDGSSVAQGRFFENLLPGMPRQWRVKVKSSFRGQTLKLRLGTEGADIVVNSDVEPVRP